MFHKASIGLPQVLGIDSTQGDAEPTAQWGDEGPTGEKVGSEWQEA